MSRLRSASSVTMAFLTGSGCAVSGGTANVGIWRPSRQVETLVCLEDSAGHCRKTIEAGHDSKARSFGGVMVTLASPGYLRARSGGATVHALALNNGFDYLSGRGGIAWGVRIGANTGSDLGKRERHALFSLPLSLLGYWGYPMFDIYGGGGYTPYANFKVTRSADSQRETLRGFHILGGTRVVLETRRNYRISAGAELEQQFLNDGGWTTLTANFGIHL